MGQAHDLGEAFSVLQFADVNLFHIPNVKLLIRYVNKLLTAWGKPGAILAVFKTFEIRSKTAILNLFEIIELGQPQYFI